MPGTYGSNEPTADDAAACRLTTLSMAVSVLQLNSKSRRVYLCERAEESCVYIWKMCSVSFENPAYSTANISASECEIMWFIFTAYHGEICIALKGK